VLLRRLTWPVIRDFIHILNLEAAGGATVYLKYDGDATTLTTANGFPLLPQQILVLENLGPRNIYTKPVQALQSSGGTTHLRVQGA
jgi:hypothetical protein